MSKKDEQTLKPFIEENKGNLEKDFRSIFSNIPEVELKEITAGELPDIINDSDDKDKIDSYFKAIINNLYSKENISLKTEYMNEDENFSGAKLEFLTSECGFHMGRAFLPIWEQKRVSLNRKSRQEIIMALWQRQNEIAEQERTKRLHEGVNI